MTDTDVMQSLADYVSVAAGRPLPAAVLEKTKHQVLDTIASMVSGSTLLPGQQAVAYVRGRGGVAEAGVVASDVVTTAENAAFANGMLAHSDETDDSHAPSQFHPGCSIVPAALAMAERQGASGAALLSAVALGYDVGARLNMSMGAIDFREAGHATHAFGSLFGAGAAAGALAGLDAQGVRYLFSYLVQQASGVGSWVRDKEHVEKAFVFAGMPARHGVEAALLVTHGWTGEEDPFDGLHGFYFTFGRGLQPDPETLGRGIGERYEIMDTNVKRWTVGSPIQAPLDSLLELIRANSITADDVEKVVVRVSQTGANTTNDRTMPDISMQQMCAVMLIDGIVTFESSHDEARMHDPRVMDLRRRIELYGDNELQRRLPIREGDVVVRLKDGRELHHHTVHVRGTTENPMTTAEVDEKCFNLMAPVFGEARSRQLCDAVWNLDSLANVRDLRPLLTARPRDTKQPAL
jgi:2-methylcitrate dehydratase PrpD